ncbi:hypothetical protein F2Q69_00036705 [Brassica cretica]|uniref:Zinc finger PMZ-type domain-containing protein n=1 Tax=Brassica cretica TaxID=69181 RepID=A0A8S9SFU8_BRACR|nr:hypothetical protein F2Q69_00036705 [Brassica cretica]
MWKIHLLKIPCRHAIKAGLTVGRAPSSLTDNMYTTSTWRTAYQETINPIDEEQEGEENAGMRQLKTSSVHRKELKKKRGASAVDVAKKIITGLRVTEPFRHVFVLDFLVFHYGVGYPICLVYLLLDFLVLGFGLLDFMQSFLDFLQCYLFDNKL